MEQLTLGFTGTSKGMTMQQLKTVRQLLHTCCCLHLGDCIGADAEAWTLANGITRVGHPPIDGKARAFLAYEVLWTAADYMVRNQSIVREGVDGLIAAPRESVEMRRSGTWSTIRRARKLGRRIWIVRPDGSIMKEEAR